MAHAWGVDALLGALAEMDVPGGPAAARKAGKMLQGRYVLTGRRARVVEGCVEVDGFDTEHDDTQVTVTFYPSQRAFDAVRQRYGSFTYRINMRQKLELNANGDGGVTAGGGEPVPPFLVTPRYRSLPQWAAAEGAHATTVVMAQQLEWFVRAVAQLHELGDVHGALQPHSVVNSVDQRGWAFWNLDAATRIGTERAIGTDLKFMPPEVAHAAQCGTERTPATTAADIWAIGVIAYELLTRQPAFPFAFPCAFDGSTDQLPAAQHATSAPDPPASNGNAAHGSPAHRSQDSGTKNGHAHGRAEADGEATAHLQQEVLDQLLGREPLQWEAESPGAEARLKCMGRFRSCVLQCLSRGPKQRPSAEGLLKLLRGVYLSQYSVR